MQTKKYMCLNHHACNTAHAHDVTKHVEHDSCEIYIDIDISGEKVTNYVFYGHVDMHMRFMRSGFGYN